MAVLPPGTHRATRTAQVTDTPSLAIDCLRVAGLLADLSRFLLTIKADEALDTLDIYKNKPQDSLVVKMRDSFRSEAPCCVHFRDLQCAP